MKERNSSLISIIMPTYKREKMIAEAIDSVLKQTYENFEIIIIDDCSPDNTENFIKETYANNEKVKYYKNEKNSGAGISRKNGYLKSNGKFLIFMDDDDYLTDPEFFKKAMQIFHNEKEELSFVSANSYIKYENTGEIETKPLNVNRLIDNKQYLEGFQTTYMKPNSTFTTIFNVDYIKDIEQVEMLNDSSIYMRALITKPAYILDDFVGIYRVHDKNMTFNLKLSFLIENLQEKKSIYEIIKVENLIENADKWLYEQIMLTADYYVRYSKPCKDNFEVLIDWCQNNGEKSKNRIVSELKEHWNIENKNEE